MSLKELREDYFVARREYDRLHKLSSAANDEMKDRERLVIEAMLADQQRSMKVTDDVAGSLTVYLSNQFSCAVTVKNELQVREWLIETEGDDQPYLMEKVNKTAVQDMLKAKIEACELDQTDVPDFLNLKTLPRLNVRGWPKS